MVKIKLSLILFLIFFITTRMAYADIVDLTCPTASSLSLSPLFAYQLEQEYLASGEAHIIKGDQPTFKLDGKTYASKADHMYAADFSWHNLACQYVGTDNDGVKKDIVIRPAEFTPILEWCYFKNSADRNHCEGDAAQCILTCEVLSK